MVEVNPENLIWARETAALHVEEAAKQLGFRDTTTCSASEKLIRLERGQQNPTGAQLNRMSRVYHQPLLVFYLPNPPIRGDRGEDFRTIPQQTRDRKGEAYLEFLMRDVKVAQSIVRDLLEDDQAEALSFINSAKISDGVEAVAQDIQAKLDFDLAKFRAKQTVRDAFAYLREQIEMKGIFVLLLSDLGSHHTTISVDLFRGFAFADDLTPFIVINRQDSMTAWSFTALHEVAHLWLGASGVSGYWSDHRVEQFCDRVARMILFPPNERDYLEIDQDTRFEIVMSKINLAAENMKVSRDMVAVTLMHEGKLDKTSWKHLQDKSMQDRNHNEQNREYQSINGRRASYYMLKRYGLGNKLINVSRDFVRTGQLSPTKASTVLGVAPTRVYPLLFADRE